MDAALAARLIALAERDQQVRERLAADGSLFAGYHREMQATHDENARALEAVIDQHGWPGERLVGVEAAEAAWLVAQHAIAQPAFQRRCLTLLQAAAAADEVAPWQAAYLEDRIRVFEGRLQVYGTSHDWDEHGRLGPEPIEQPETVDLRRAAVGLPPLGPPAAPPDEPPPPDLAARRREMDAWARIVGWRD